jgi:8-oxo-dGTP diphosphatase
MSYSYKYPHFALTVDCLLFSKQDNKPVILLIQRKHEPFQDYWAFPGGYLEIEELTEQAAYRELREETGIENVKLKKLDYFDTINRDPRERTITFAYWAWIDNINEIQFSPQDDAKSVKWFSLDNLPQLAFDHKTILETALKRDEQLKCF